MEDKRYEQDAVELAEEMIGFLQENDMFIDICIYAGGNRYCSDYNAPDGYIVEKGLDAHDYFQWAPKNNHIFSMSFEGPLNHVLNGYVRGPREFIDEFNALFEKHGLYYEFGDAWNLTCYPI